MVVTDPNVGGACIFFVMIWWGLILTFSVQGSDIWFQLMKFEKFLQYTVQMNNWIEFKYAVLLINWFGFNLPLTHKLLQRDWQEKPISDHKSCLIYMEIKY